MTQMAQLVRDEREARGWSQYELEKHSGVSQGHISRIEMAKCNPTLEIFLKLAIALNIRIVDRRPETHGRFATLFIP